MTGTGEQRAVLVRGMSWMMVQTVCVRLVTFGGQLVLGWLLLPQAFGLYAIALAAANAVGALRNGGVAQLLLRPSPRDQARAGPLAQFALLFNLLAAAVLVGLGPWLAGRYGSPELPGLLLWIALSLPLGTPAVIFRCRLTVDSRFRELTYLGLASTLFWQLATIGMALGGYGAYSYVVPTALQAVLESALGYAFVREWTPLLPRLSWQAIRTIFTDTRWVMLGAAMLSLATTGDYLAIGLLSDTATVGRYFFAFQLLVAIGTVLNSGLESILPSTLARLEADPTRQRRAVLDLLELLMAVAWPLAALVSVAARPLIHVLWGGRWDEAADAVQIMAWCLPAWLCVAVARALIESRGRWRLRFLFLGTYGVGAIASSAAGAALGSLSAITMLVTGFYLAYACALTLWMPSVLGGTRGAALRPLLLPGAVSLATAIALGVAGRQLDGAPAGASAWAMIGLCGLLLAALNTLLLRSQWRGARGIWVRLRGLLPRAAVPSGD